MIFNQASQAMQKIYDTARAGAELEYTEDRFDRLAASIGTTSDALMDDLGEATRGLYSDAELMNSAMEFMSLGLAKTHDEAVRLARVAGALNMNMNQLVLTLTNQTTMRFDAIGVSVDGFDEKVKQLEKTGMKTNDAFKEAFLQQAEEQIERVGEAADSAIGNFMKMESSWENFVNSIKKGAAEMSEGAVKGLTVLLDKNVAYQKAIDRGVFTVEEYSEAWKKMREEGKGQADYLEWIIQQTEAYENSLEFANQDIGYMIDNWYRAGLSAEEVSARLIEMGIRTEETGDALREMGDISKNTFDNIITLTQNYTETQDSITEKQERINGLTEALAQGTVWRDFGMGAQDARDEIGDLEDEIIGLEEQMQQSTNNIIWNMAMAAVDFKTATAEEIADLFDLGIELGMVTEESISGVTENLSGMLSTLGEEGSAQLGAILEALGLIDSYVIDDKHFNVSYAVQGPGGSGLISSPIQKPGATEDNAASEASGGRVYADDPYLWQEYGYRGEVMVPSQDGYILSRSDAKQILASAGGNGRQASYGGPTADEIARAVRDGIMAAGVI
jgi:hypothetical protein